MRLYPTNTLLRRQAALAGACLLLLAGCAGLPESAAPPAPASVQAGLDSARFAQIDSAIGEAIGERRLPGAVFHLERDGAVYEQAYGRFSYEPDAAAVMPGTVFDAASLSKVLSTAPSVLLLAEEGRIDLEAKLADYFPECAGGGKDAITIRHLLTHTSGLAAGLPAKPAWSGDTAAHALACAQAVTHAPGSFFRYSDINYILLGQLVRKVSGMPLDVFAQERIFGPLGMRDTGYLPLRRMAAAAIAPTQKIAADAGASVHGDVAGNTAGGLLQGVVHDPTVRRIGGVAGSAGVFTTARDVARFARMLLSGGTLDGVRILGPDSVRLLVTVQSPPGIAALRGLGMDIDSPYALRPRGSLYPVGSFGHTGFTGCILWIDPGSRSFYVLLSNRVYPDDKANVLPLYTRLGTLAAQASGLSEPGVKTDAAAP
ncbi:beta-lactamase family protein [Massilia sp. IC2-278]|uniref:serine hydrolase domain-containing protein n=1 Tax=Massilia sp. IC2-278 TaxID=2887200 RepID=UPI001E38C4B5|nr:serine hydrolase domain-containing protein [Massilia sp. IC2-278]MCC2961183.1 beta-lactamase family protein [Massilia sp. IC2-278]